VTSLWLANSYTDSAYGIWPFVVAMLLSGALVIGNAPAARFFVRHFTGPWPGMPQEDRFRRMNESRAWLIIVRAVLGVWAAGVFVGCFMAVIGWLPG
jgi:hypothetical protein